MLTHERSRIAVLAICLALIGGTGCITMSVVDSVQRQAAQREREERARKAFLADQAAAAQGDVLAVTRLGMEYVSGPVIGQKDVKQGVALLEQAVARDFGPAEYALGKLLLSGFDTYRWTNVAPEQLPRDPARGMELLKRAATHECWTTTLRHDSGGWNMPAGEVGDIYRQGRLVARDRQQADLWLARSIVHCRYPNPGAVSYHLGAPAAAQSPQAQAETLAFLLLFPPGPEADKLRAALSADAVHAAEERAAQLRELVRTSEQQYPIPSKRGRP